MKNKNALVEIIAGALTITGALYLLCRFMNCNEPAKQEESTAADDITGLPMKSDGITPIHRKVIVNVQEPSIFPENMLENYPENYPSWTKLQ